jgi:hypothetical protein
MFLKKHVWPALPDYPQRTISKIVLSGLLGQKKKTSTFLITLDKTSYTLGEKI